MDVVNLARWQFAITTIYHFFMVPLTIGLSLMVAWFNTRWYRHGDEADLMMTKFFGKLFMINFAMGVATGLVQEFQFGMNWNQYSRFVGDVFGAPLAMEGLLAFFLESTFIGLWAFGWGRLRPKVHLATIWLATAGSWLSAYFIIAANSFMQHPVGATYNAERGRAEMTDLWAVLTNSTTLSAYPHVIAGAVITGSVFVAGVSAWSLLRRRPDGAERRGFESALRLATWVTLVAGLALVISGDRQAKLMFEQQPMKMASAEALCNTEKGAGISVFAVGDVGNRCDVRSIVIPGLLSFLATEDFDGTVTGVNQLQEEMEQKYGPGEYAPSIVVSYWSFRAMIGFGLVGAFGAAVMLFRMRKHASIERTGIPAWLSIAIMVTPFLGNTAGWVLTEVGRQPWVVAPNPTGEFELRLLTRDAVSANVGSGTVLFTLVSFAALYLALGVLELWLLSRYVRKGPEPVAIDEGEPADHGADDGADVLAY